MDKRGYSRIGKFHHRAKLEESDIPLIRGLYQEGLMIKDIADKFEVASPTISDVISKKTWRHVA